VSAVKSSHNGKNTAAAGEKLQQEMLSPFVYICRHLYLKTHNIHNRQTSMPRWDSNPQSQQASRCKSTP